MVRRQPKSYVSNIHSLLKMVKSTGSMQDALYQDKLVVLPGTTHVAPPPSYKSEMEQNLPQRHDYGAITTTTTHSPNWSADHHQKRRFYRSPVT